MSEICCVCSKPIEGEVLVARHEGWEKNWHPVCFAEAASAEIAALRSKLKELGLEYIAAVGQIQSALEERDNLRAQLETQQQTMAPLIDALEQIRDGMFRYNMGDYESCAKNAAWLALAQVEQPTDNCDGGDP